MATAFYDQWHRNLNADDLYNRFEAVGIDDEFSEFDHNRGNWEPLPENWFNSYPIGGNGFSSVQENTNWTLHRTDQGAFTFRSENLNSGLLIQLASTHSDWFGHWIVVDPSDDRGAIFLLRRDASVGHLHPFAPTRYGPGVREVPGSRKKTPLRLNFAKPTDLWVRYDHGLIQVGRGTQPEVSTLWEFKVPKAPPGILQYGFGQIGAGNARSVVRNVHGFKYVPKVNSLPPLTTSMGSYTRPIAAGHYMQQWRPHLYLK